MFSIVRFVYTSLFWLLSCNLYAAVDATKFNPGPYLLSNPSGSLSDEEVHQHNLDFIHKYAKEDSVRGFKLSYRWTGLEPEPSAYKLDQIAEVLELGRRYKKQVGLFIDVRAFGRGTCPGNEQPRWMFKQNMLYEATRNKQNKVCLPKWWEPRVMDKLIQLYQQIGLRFDAHPNLEFVTEGESTIEPSHGFTEAAYHEQMTRLLTASKEALPTTMILMQVNFYHDTKALLKAMVDTGGVAFGLPDVVPCRIPSDQARKKYTNERCSYVIDNYELMIEYGKQLSIAPNAETWDLFYEQTEAVYLMAADYLQADHIFLTEVFCSRRDKRECVKDYIDLQVLPVLKKHGNLMHEECPTSFGRCVRVQ